MLDIISVKLENKYQLFHGAECNIGSIFRIGHILQKLQNIMRNKENICQYWTRQRAITALLLNSY